MIKYVKNYVNRAYKTACNHGFHEKELSVEHMMMLVVSEIGEMVEADRKNMYADVESYKTISRVLETDDGRKLYFEEQIKDTVYDELADVCIRLFDFFGCKQINPDIVSDEDLWGELKEDWELWFKEKSLCECAYNLVSLISDLSNESGKVELSQCMGCCLVYIEMWAAHLGVDLDWYIGEKMWYNSTRGMKHGKRY